MSKLVVIMIIVLLTIISMRLQEIDPPIVSVPKPTSVRIIRVEPKQKPTQERSEPKENIVEPPESYFLVLSALEDHVKQVLENHALRVDYAWRLEMYKKTNMMDYLSLGTSAEKLNKKMYHHILMGVELMDDSQIEKILWTISEIRAKFGRTK